MPTRKVLVVDDDRLTCWALKNGLAAGGRIIDVVTDGRTAIEKISCTPYDLVLLDIHLGDANGLALLEGIRALSPNTSVVMISGDSTEGSRKTAQERGASDFIGKPFDLAQVNEVVDAILGSPARGC